MKPLVLAPVVFALASLTACGPKSTTTPEDVQNDTASPAEETSETSDAMAEAEAERQAALERLQADRADMRAAADEEDARWTDEMRAKATKLAGRRYKSVRSGLKSILASELRLPGNAERDQYRHPAETLEFLGLKPSMTVFEYGPGAGWYTEILAPFLAKRGKLIVTMSDPEGPIDERATYYAERTQRFLDRSPELYGNVERLIVEDEPALELEGTVDMVLVVRGMHGMVNHEALGAWLAEFHKALKPGGILAVVQHRADPGADPVESAKQGYLPEPWVIEQIEAAGFELASSSEINANEKDTRDYPRGVWTLPPSLALGEENRDTYLAIGESDRMTLKFEKVAQ